jgi:hypothetical protein
LQTNDFQDSYKIEMMLENENGDIRKETHENMSLSDFEGLYGTITDHIISIEMRLMYNGKHTGDSEDSEWKWKNWCEYI